MKLLSMRSFLLVVVFFGSLVTFNVASHRPVVFAQSSNTTNTIVVQTSDSKSLTDKIVSRTKTSWPWYVTRASGLIASLLLVILILSGIGMVTGYTFRFLEPLTAWATHRALGLAFGCAVLLHIFSLLFDHFVTFNIYQLLFPFISKYRPLTLFGVHLGSLYVALGIIAFYGVIAVIISSLLWVEKKPYTWKLLHFITYLIMTFIFIHALYLGTDLAHGVLRWLWIAGGIAVAIAIIHRLRRARTL